MASSKSIFSQEVLTRLRLYHFVTHWGKEVVYNIYNISFLQGQNKSICEILIDNQVPLGNKSPLSAQEIDKIRNKSPKDLDITVMNKICQSLWQKGVNDPGDELRGLVRKIKDVRNFVSHEAPDMSGTDLESQLRDFQAMLEETLEKTKSLFPAHVASIDQLKAAIQDAVPTTLEKIREKYDSSNPQDVQRLKEEIEEFGSEFSEIIQKSFEQELLSLYERLCQILPYDWLAQYGLADPCNIMICLKVVDDMELNNRLSGKKSIIVNQQEIFKIKDPMGKDPEVVIISGDAGSGKTTILCSYAEGWCKKTTDMPELSSFTALLYMQFRNHDHDNFDDYLKSLIPQTVARFPVDLVKLAVLDSTFLVLCDGYDEANEKSRRLFEEMLALNSSKMKFVVTTRPGNTERLTKIVNEGKRSRINLRVSGLQEQDMILLTEKLVGHLSKDDVTQQEQMKSELLQKIKEMNTGTSAVLQTPLYFNLFVLLYIECPYLRDEMSTRTSVYLQLRKHKIKRITNKTGTSVESLEEFDALYRKWSLKHYIEEKYEWSETDVRSFKREISCPKAIQNFDAIMSSYFSIKKASKHLETVKVYCHRHRSEQEFAVAGNVCDDIITSSGRTQGGNVIRDVLRLKGLWDGDNQYLLFRKLREVISFIPGILYSTERDVLHNTIDDLHELCVSYSLSYEDHDTLLEPCIETRLDDQVLELLVSLTRKTSLKDRVRFDQTKCLYVLPSLLPKLRPKEISLRFSSNVPRDLSLLNETLEAATHNNIRTEIWIRTHLKEYTQLAGQILHPVDYLVLEILSRGDQDLVSLRPSSLVTPSSAKELTVKYVMAHTPADRITQVINKTFPTNRQEGTTDLKIDCWRAPDIELLLQSLTVRPLRSISISASSTKKD
ncbi:uncharacterized protein [Macrobrachium rosenbergii]|uniref:uncharacterized protein n=1 Tax=Macrobrachium rosenbergii TaxID=79674 RepID=UPI0034D5CAA3